MKNRIILLIASILFLFASCVNGGKGDNILRPKQERIQGPLGEFFKVVDRTYSIRTVQFGLGTKLQVNIEIERIKEGLPKPWNEHLRKIVGDESGQLEPSFTVEFLDGGGDVVCKSESHVYSNKSELQSLVDLSVGESCSISFDVDTNTPVQFKVNSSFHYHSTEDVHKEVKLIDSKEACSFHARFDGRLQSDNGKFYPIVMDIQATTPDSRNQASVVSGYYFYKSKSEDNNIKLKGSFSSSMMTLISADGTEVFEGEFDTNSAYTGIWNMNKNNKTTTLSFALDIISFEEYAPNSNTITSAMDEVFESSTVKEATDASSSTQVVSETSKKEEAVSKSDSPQSIFLKSATKKLLKLKKDMDAVSSGKEFRLVLADYNDFVDEVPDEINKKFDDEIMQIDGGEAYLDAVAAFMRSYYRAKEKYGEDYF